MRKIDRLILKAKSKCGTEKLVCAFIYPGDIYGIIVRADIWNGINGSGLRSEFCTCSTVNMALQELDRMAEKYPNDEDVQIIIDDLI